MKKQTLQFVAIPLAATLAAWIGVQHWLHAGNAALGAANLIGPPAWSVPYALPEAASASAPFRVVSTSVTRGSNLGQTLKDLGLLANEREALMSSMADYVKVTRVAAGTRLKASYSAPEDQIPSRIELRLGETQTLVNDRVGEEQWTSTLRDIPVERRLEAYSGVVSSSLHNSAASAGMDPRLISHLSEVFAWVVDFNRGIHLDDRWRLTIERLYVDGQATGYGEILAAEYDNGGTVYSAVRYNDSDSASGYYTPAGNSLRRMFLRCPLRYAHITSGFSAQRFHPILKVNKPHNGVDYGAPTGTPIMAVGEGLVTFARAHGPSGKMITVKHNGIYESDYKHLSAFAKGIVPGAKVTTGQVIGYVGATGLATGPHLHFEFHINGRYVDPNSMKFPAANPIAVNSMPHFKVVAAAEMAELPPWSAGVVTQASIARGGNRYAE